MGGNDWGRLGERSAHSGSGGSALVLARWHCGWPRGRVGACLRGVRCAAVEARVGGEFDSEGWHCAQCTSGGGGAGGGT